jgi:thiosulfate/3-mercaptopyruvate sulfurtransferase
VIVDCRFQLTDTGAGRRSYAEGHLPGAVYAHLDQDLSGPVTADSGRHPLPDPEALARRLRAWGVSQGSQVVVYDDAGGGVAARLWWLLRWLGHGSVAVLDGGIQAWKAAGKSLAGVGPLERGGNLKILPNNDLWLSVDKLLEEIAQQRILLVDARAAVRFRGEDESIDPIAGHVPGAVNRPFELNLDAAGRFRPPSQLRTLWLQALGGMAAGSVVQMCGSGVTACHNLLAMEIAGLGGSKLYPGSWSEWIRDPGRAVATGA